MMTSAVDVWLLQLCAGSQSDCTECLAGVQCLKGLYACGVGAICDDPLAFDNGKCDPSNNSEACQYDGGDCCEGTCVSSVFQCDDANNVFDCQDPFSGLGPFCKESQEMISLKPSSDLYTAIFDSIDNCIGQDVTADCIAEALLFDLGISSQCASQCVGPFASCFAEACPQCSINSASDECESCAGDAPGLGFAKGPGYDCWANLLACGFGNVCFQPTKIQVCGCRGSSSTLEKYYGNRLCHFNA